MSASTSAGARAPVRVRCAAVSVAVACSNGCSDRRSASGACASRTWRSGTETAWPIASARAAACFAARRRAFGSAASRGTLAARLAARRSSSSALGAWGSCRSLPVARGARARGRAGGSAATTAPRRSAGRLPCRVSCCSARAVRSTDRVRPRRMIILGSMLARLLRSSSMQGGKACQLRHTHLYSARIWADDTRFTPQSRAVSGRKTLAIHCQGAHLARGGCLVRG